MIENSRPEVLEDYTAALRDPLGAGRTAGKPGGACHQEGDPAMAQPSPGTPPVSPVPPGTYRLDPDRSTIRVDVKTFLGLMTVHGSFQLESGQVIIAADPLTSTAQAVIDARSFASGNTIRDHDVISADLLDSSTYPTITFISTRVRPDGASWVMSGSVTARGTSADTEVRVREARMERMEEGGAARFRATATLDRTSFGLTKRKNMIGQMVEVVIDAIGVPT
jgi:polyisoprenoid-binding protein YceI